MTPEHHIKPTMQPSRNCVMQEDNLSILIRAARRELVRTGQPANLPYYLRIKDSLGNTALAIAIQPTAMSDATISAAPTKWSVKQRKILAALLFGPKKGDVLAKEIGYASRSSLHAGRGINALLQAGLVVNDEVEGYSLTGEGEDEAEGVAE